MMRILPFLLLTLPAAAQEGEQDVVGTLTATVDAEEMTYVVVAPGERPSSGFARRDGVVDVRLVARPDRSPVEQTPVLEVRFLVSGMGPTAEVSEARVRYTGRDGETLSTMGGLAEVSLTAFGMEEDEVTTTGNFASQLRDEAGGTAELGIEGDFQASLRLQDFAEFDDATP